MKEFLRRSKGEQTCRRRKFAFSFASSASDVFKSNGGKCVGGRRFDVWRLKRVNEIDVSISLRGERKRRVGLDADGKTDDLEKRFGNGAFPSFSMFNAEEFCALNRDFRGMKSIPAVLHLSKIGWDEWRRWDRWDFFHFRRNFKWKTRFTPFFSVAIYGYHSNSSIIDQIVFRLLFKIFFRRIFSQRRSLPSSLDENQYIYADVRHRLTSLSFHWSKSSNVNLLTDTDIPISQLHHHYCDTSIRIRFTTLRSYSNSTRLILKNGSNPTNHWTHETIHEGFDSFGEEMYETRSERFVLMEIDRIRLSLSFARFRISKNRDGHCHWFCHYGFHWFLR